MGVVLVFKIMFIYIECIILIFIEKYWIDKKKSSFICKVNNDLLNRYNFVLVSFFWKSFEVKKLRIVLVVYRIY